MYYTPLRGINPVPLGGIYLSLSVTKPHIANTVAARRWFRLMPTGTGFRRVSINKS